MSDNKREIKVTIHVGEYYLHIENDDSFFLRHEDGKGMGISNDDLAKMFADWLANKF